MLSPIPVPDPVLTGASNARYRRRRHQAPQPRRDGRPRGARHPGGLVCQSRDRHPDRDRRPRAAGARGDLPFRERRPRHGSRAAEGQDRSVADQRRQAVCDAAPGRQLLPPRRQLLDDPRRASRSLRAGRVPGGGERRHRQLGDVRERHRARGRRRDGPRRRRQAALGADGAHHQGRHVEAGASLLVSADRGRRGEARLHQPRGARRDRARLRGARHGAGADVRRVAGRTDAPLHRSGCAPT